MNAILLKTDGTARVISPDNGKRFTLKELQGFVGGYIERAPYTAPHEIWVDEEGLLKGKPLNVAASAIAKRPLAGDAVLFEESEWGDDDEDSDDEE
jgi:hypothetical protein